MNEDKINRINSYINTQSLSSNKNMIKTLLILILLFLMFYVGDCVTRNISLFKSYWMIFLIVALLLVIWGVYLYFTLEKHRLSFILYWALSGTYISIEFFAIAISKGINITHTNSYLLILLELLDIPFIIWLTLYRDTFIEHKKRAKKAKIRNASILSLMILILVIVFIILKGSDMEETLPILISIMLGYIFSIHILFIQDYYIARKYKESLQLYQKI